MHPAEPARGRQAGPTGQTPPGPSQGRPSGLDPGRARARRDVRNAAAPVNGGTAEAGPERARGGAHGDEEEAASLTGNSDGGEWPARRRWAAAGGGVRRGTRRGRRGEAPP